MGVLKEDIERFLTDDGHGAGVGVGYGLGEGSGGGDVGGAGYGNGDGAGYGYGVGDGTGHGDGEGYGEDEGEGAGYGNGWWPGAGYGEGAGKGNGDGEGVKTISGYDVHMVDGVQTIITDIHGDVAKGFILQKSLILKPCYIVKGDRKFAHGYTLHEAWESLQSKILATASTEDRIAKFVEAHPDKGKKYPAADLFEWHHRLTGSCLAGRKAFCSDHGIDITRDEFTIDEFVELTKGAYGGDIIKRLKGIA